MSVSSISPVTAVTDTNINVVVIFTTTDRPANYSSITLQCFRTSDMTYIDGSTNLNYSYNAQNPHWSGNWSLSNLTPGTSYTYKCFINGAEQYGIQRDLSTTGTAPQPPSTPSLSLNSVNGLNISVNVSNISLATNVEFDYYWLSGYPDANMTNSGSYSANWNFSVSNYDTTYTMDCRGVNGQGTSAWSTSISFSTGAAPPPPIPSTPVSGPTFDPARGTGGRVEDGFYLQVDNISGATSYDVEVLNEAGNSVLWTQNTIATSGIYFGGVGYGNLYRVRYRAKNSGGSSGNSPLVPALTSPQSVAFTGSAVGGTTARINPPRPSGNWTTIIIERWNSGKTTKQETVSTTATSYDFTGLISNTTYQFTGRVSYTRTVDGSSVTVTSYNDSQWTSVTTNARPADFAWTTAKTAGGTFNITASEWRSFQDRINDFRAFKGLGSFGYVESFTGTGAFGIAHTNDLFYAYFINQAITAINGMVATGVATKSPGDSVFASNLNTLRDKLNSITP